MPAPVGTPTRMTRLGRGLAFWREQRAQAFAEFAIALPVVVFGFLGGADFARAFAAQLAVQNASRAAAEADAIGVVTTDAAVADRARQELAKTAGVDPADANVTVTRTTQGGERYVTVEVRYTFRTILPWPGVPNVATFGRTTTFREFP